MGIKGLWLLVMSRLIYSFYIDIQKPVSHFENQKKFNDNHQWLLDRQKQYAELCGVEYKHFGYDENYIEFSKKFGPEISEYNIINFYKIHLLYQLDYDEILYLDFDVIPVTKLNFFEEWDLSKGIAIMSERASTWRLKDHHRERHSVRSPLAKYWNARALCEEEKDVFNTGIIGASKKCLEELDYFSDIDDILQRMSDLINDEFWPEDIRNLFGYDNETIIACKLDEYQQLRDTGWHHFMDKWSYIPKRTKFIHCINKDFEYVRNWCEKNNL
jgi:hypothetical protein